MIPDLSDSRIAALEVTPLWAGSLSIQSVDDAFLAAGLPKELLPRTPSRATCMKRAFEHVAPRGARIDPLPKSLGVAMSLKDVAMLDLEALASATGTEVKSAASYNATLTAKILVVHTNGMDIETLTFTPHDHPMVPLVTETYRAMREQYKASEDLSVWFSQTIIPGVRGVGKRSRGGVYYITANHKDLILKVAKALDTVSTSSVIDREVNGVKCPVTRLTHGGKLCIEPRYADDAACMEIMIDGVIRDADTSLDELAAALEPGDGKKPLGKRGLASKREECLQLESQIKLWESVCSVSLPLLQNRLLEIQAGIGTAELAAEMRELQDGV